MPLPAIVYRFTALMPGSYCRFSRWYVSNRLFPVTFRQNRHGILVFRHLRNLRSVFFKHFTIYQFQFPPVLLIIILLLQGCGSHIYHFVEPGETLYSISWAYGHDYREVAKWNNIQPPYIIKKGQRLRVAAPSSKAPVVDKSINNSRLADNNDAANKESTAKADKQSVAATSAKAVSGNRSAPESIQWQWPIKGGKLVQTFNARTPGQQGVDVAGNMGQPVYSAAPGRVVYSGGGLNRYGKLIIVKHNDTFLSAYAHNKRLLVKEGELLKAGQMIAEMGSTGTNRTRAKLHFEIRRNGKPVDPLHYLPEKNAVTR